MNEPTIHASAVSIDGRGILIRGESAAGKSTLVLDIMDEARRDGHKAALIGDDRITLKLEDGRVFAYGMPNYPGQIEVRGIGIIEVPHVEKAPVCLIVDLGDATTPRFPDEKDLVAPMLGQVIPRIYLFQREYRPVRLVRLAFDRMGLR
jgi:serine kinase of HPr protein (carbohydrate metabolism regulator)